MTSFGFQDQPKVHWTASQHISAHHTDIHFPTQGIVLAYQSSRDVGGCRFVCQNQCTSGGTGGTTGSSAPPNSPRASSDASMTLNNNNHQQCLGSKLRVSYPSKIQGAAPDALHRTPPSIIVNGQQFSSPAGTSHAEPPHPGGHSSTGQQTKPRPKEPALPL